MDEVATLNGAIKSWLGHSALSASSNHHQLQYPNAICASFLVYKFFTTYQIRCNPLSGDGRSRLDVVSKDFIAWVRKFVQKNRIYFPHVETLFSRLIYCVVPVSAGTLESGYYAEEEEDSARRDYVLQMKKGLMSAMESRKQTAEERELDVVHGLMEATE